MLFKLFLILLQSAGYGDLFISSGFEILHIGYKGFAVVRKPSPVWAGLPSYSAALLISATDGASLLRCLVPNPRLTLTLTLTQVLPTALSFLSSNSLTGNGQMGQYDRRWESPDLYYN